MRKLTEKTPPRRPAAFTLIELLVAIGIIAVLVGLLTPAIYNVLVRARVTEVKADIAQIEGAIADFNLKFGMNPPSRVTVHETQAGWNSDKRSRSIIRRLWPDFDFTKPRAFGLGASSIELRGDQCLVFFLGGGFEDLDSDGIGDAFRGFSSDPTDPFQFSTSTSTRIGPFMDFDPERVIADPGKTTLVYPNDSIRKFPVYVDPLPAQTHPYIYASSDEGLGYSETTTDSDLNTPATQQTWPSSAPGFFRIYRTDTLGTAADAKVPEPWKARTYQVISPGRDSKYGKGGPYKPDQTNNRLPAFNRTGAAPGIDVKDPERSDEEDNITNFSDGTLVP